jgi:hypothetical protein
MKYRLTIPSALFAATLSGPLDTTVFGDEHPIRRRDARATRPPKGLSMNHNRRLIAAVLALAAAATGLMSPAAAQTRGDRAASELSAASVLPVALSVTAPAILLGGSGAMTVVAVEKASDATVWVFERASDGARASVRFAGEAVGGLALAAGTTVAVSATASGWVLHQAGKAIAFVPNEIGRTLLHHERITR